jgi:small subunit ribosomal protein S3
MGQKVDPGSFRRGITKNQSSVWCVNFKVFGKILEEDFKIREIFKTEFEPLYNKGGLMVTKIEIRRQFKTIIILIHGTNYHRFLYRERGLRRPEKVGDIFLNLELLRAKIEKNLNRPNEVRLEFKPLLNPVAESSIFAQFITELLEKRVRYRQVFKRMGLCFKRFGIKNYKIQISGRLDGADMARSEWIQEGRLPRQTLRASISYSKTIAKTKYGILGVKLWICDKVVS